MDTIFATLACCLLAPSLAVAQTEKGGNFSLTFTQTVTNPGLNLTHIIATATSSNSTVHATVQIKNLTDDTAFTSTTADNETFTTTATTESTNHPETSQSTTIMTPPTNSTSLTTTTPGTQTPTFSALTTPEIQTTVGYISTPDTALITTANSSSTVSTTSDSTYRTTQGKHQVDFYYRLDCSLYVFI